MRTLLIGPASMLLALATLSFHAQAPATIQARKMLWPGGKPTFDEWKSYPIQTLADLKLPAADKADADQDKYGGRTDRKAAATGFFHTQKLNGRWWMIDPLGNLYLNNAIVDLHPGTSPVNQEALAATFKTSAEWMRRTHELLLKNGIHSAGAWSSGALIRASPLQGTQPLSYSVNLDLMSAYGKHRGGVYAASGHQGYPQDTIFVFDPEFPVFIDKYLDRIDATKDDPNLLGFFSDNEIPLYRSNLDGFLKLPETDPGNIAARAWMKDQHATEITRDLRIAFLKFEADRYFQIVTTAIRKHDPNHMYLGSRFTSQQLADPELFQALGKYADAISINYYSNWVPEPAAMAMWEHESGKPFMITEFYVKGEDSGLVNLTGAGWLVHTQADRGLFYQTFVLDLLASGKCVGWHWFKYQDNDPADAKADLSNVNSNKGIVDAKYKTYDPLLQAMKPLNSRIYQIVDQFDGKLPSAAAPTKPE